MWSRASRKEPIEVRFIQPAIATFLACTRIARGQLHVDFVNDTQEYAKLSGLDDALAANHAAMSKARRGQQGQTWSPLTTLFHHAEIEACNQTINDLIFAQLGGMPRAAIDAMARVVGELHDNIASHADGRGFSAAQFYPSRSDHPARLELSVADAGCGFLSNVRRAQPSITNHEDAIRWCLKKGNTAGRHTARTLPQDAIVQGDPYAESEGGSDQRDHHMGWGLHLLTELIRASGGELWIWTGDTSFTMNKDGTSAYALTPLPWPGVMLNITLFPASAQAMSWDLSSPRLQSLAEDLGL
ncbi:hypothetical protein [Nannocystis sp.]|uniref:hypothetical protein n=1 Tax=Nannocystis sp. TaxID=1962667 RepID=UPI0025F07586|nr:hypothetical protein [Nannocystis sp.]MBK7827683.1 hypothetical protein [Nannocystis sp.]